MGAFVKWGEDTPITTVEWLWKPFIPYGKVTILQGDGGDGKTTLMLKIAAMLSQGLVPPENRMGNLVTSGKTEPITTFYASTEEEISDSALPRFLRNGGDRKLFAYSHESRGHLNLSYEDISSAIEQTGAKLVIIDPLQAFLPENTSLNNVARMRPLFTQLSNAAMETGAAIVLIGHMNKNEGAKDIHRGLGSADIAASVRSIVLVSTVKGDRGLRMIRTVKSNFDESCFVPVGFRLDAQRKVYFCELEGDDEDGYYSCSFGEEENEDTPPTKLELAVSFIRKTLTDEPIESLEMYELCKNEGISKRTAERAKKELGIPNLRKGGKVFWVPPVQNR